MEYGRIGPAWYAVRAAADVSPNACWVWIYDGQCLADIVLIRPRSDAISTQSGSPPDSFPTAHD
jgi:hypothetical protein